MNEPKTMKCYTNTSFTGLYPVGVSAVMWANSPEEATRLLNEELVKQGLPGDAKLQYTNEFRKKDEVEILNDGNY